MNQSVILIILAGVCMGLYDFFQKISSRYLPPFVVALISSMVAITGSILVIGIAKVKGSLNVNLSLRAILAAMAVGIAAFGIEVFGVWAYSKGLPVSTGSFITAAVPAVTATILGLIVFSEGLTLQRIFAMFIVLIGVVLLSRS